MFVCDVIKGRTGFEWPRDAADEYGLPRVERKGRVQNKVGVRKSPRPDLDGLVLDGGRGDAEVQLVLVLYALVDQ